MGRKLKRSYLDETKRDQILSGIEADRQKLNTSVVTLREKLGINISDIETLKAVSVDWCKNFVKEAEEGYLKNLSPFVVKTVQNDVHDKFAASFYEAAPHCSVISYILRKRKFNIKQDSKGRFWFDEKEIKAYASDMATVHYSEDEVEFCDKVCEIVDAINEFEKWAEAKGFDPFFTEQRSFIWNGGTTTSNVIAMMTDQELTGMGGVENKNHLTFDAETFRKMLNEGYINQNK